VGKVCSRVLQDAWKAKAGTSCITSMSRVPQPPFLMKMAKLPSRVVIDGDPELFGYARPQLDRGVDLPMHQDSATSFEPLAYKGVCGREMLQ